MRQLDRLHLEFPFAGSRMLQGLLAAEGSKIGRRHVKTLMRRMGIEALYRRPRTTKPEPGHKIYPYLLRGVEITRPNQVWAMDITYIPMARDFAHLAVVLDWFSRRSSAVVERVDYDGGGILRRDAGECTLSPRQAGDLQHGSRQPVHRCGIHRRADQKRDCRQHGRQAAPRATTSLSSGCGALSNTRRCISEPTTPRPRPARRSGATSTSTIGAGRIRALTARPPITPTPPRCPSARQPNLGRRSTYRRGKTVQTTGATSDCGGN